MDHCCNAKQKELVQISRQQKRVLKIVLLINLSMFFIEGGLSLFAGSTALFADSLDMLGDAFVYAISLYAIGKSAQWNQSISFIKGLLMAGFGVGVVIQAGFRFFTPGLPLAETMGWVAGLALVANVICALLLLRHRSDNLNMRSTWLCSRNDVIANTAVIVAAGLVALTQSKIPDLVVGIAIATLVLKSSVSVLKESLKA